MQSYSGATRIQDPVCASVQHKVACVLKRGNFTAASGLILWHIDPLNLAQFFHAIKHVFPDPYNKGGQHTHAQAARHSTAH
jgi:hypothetical protein